MFDSFSSSNMTDLLELVENVTNKARRAQSAMLKGGMTANVKSKAMKNASRLLMDASKELQNLAIEIALA